jgi:hypothetical protein
MTTKSLVDFRELLVEGSVKSAQTADEEFVDANLASIFFSQRSSLTHLFFILFASKNIEGFIFCFKITFKITEIIKRSVVFDHL